VAGLTVHLEERLAAGDDLRIAWRPLLRGKRRQVSATSLPAAGRRGRYWSRRRSLRANVTDDDHHQNQRSAEEPVLHLHGGLNALVNPRTNSTARANAADDKAAMNMAMSRPWTFTDVALTFVMDPR